MFRLSKATAWADAGHEIAWQQFKLPLVAAASKTSVERATAGLPPLKLGQDGGATIRGKDFVVAIDKKRGWISSLKYHDTELIQAPLRPDFWRAPTDNDRGNGMPRRRAEWQNVYRSWKVTSLRVDQPSPQRVDVVVQADLPEVASQYALAYTIFGDGRIVVDAKFTPGDKKGLSELPRFGMQMTLPAGFETLTWYGRGPWETYCDRNDAWVNIFHGKVADQFFRDYVKPGESGNKVEVRWAALTNLRGVGLLAVGVPLLSVNASHSTAEDLERAKHPYAFRLAARLR